MWEILRVSQVILWEKKARNSQGIDSSLLALIILNLMQLLYARTSHALIPGLEPSASGERGGVWDPRFVHRRPHRRRRRLDSLRTVTVNTTPRLMSPDQVPVGAFIHFTNSHAECVLS